MKILVTGVAGFIGMHVAQSLLARGETVIGIDNLNNYYDIKLKLARLSQLQLMEKFKFELIDIADRSKVASLFEYEKFDRVVHLAAQAGVRYSIKNPHAYVDSNLIGFVNVLEGCRHTVVEHLVYASSSSVYGGNTKIPFSEDDAVDHPVSLYAATKKANELMAYTYSHLYKLRTTGLRFFTVYGPWGRPDMSPWLFTSAIMENRSIDVFNYGRMKRDFTYIDDIVDGTLLALDRISKRSDAQKDKLTESKIDNNCKIYNIGGNYPVELELFISKIEEALKVKAKINYLPMQPGDVVTTFADISELKKDTGFSPKIDIEKGINQWINWYKNNYETKT